MSSAIPMPVPPPSPALRSLEAHWLERDAAPAADPLAHLRAEAMKRVMRLGLPTLRDETWRYTNMRHINSRALIEAPQAAPAGGESAGSLSLLSVDEPAVTVLMMNGRPVLPSSTDTRINGLEISSLEYLSRNNPALIADHLQSLSDADQARWGLVNAALFRDGLYVKVSGQVATPLVILHVLTADGANQVAHPRVIIDAAPGARATVIEHYVERGVQPPLCNSATQVAAAADARIEHYRVFTTGARAEHVDSLHVRQARDSHCKQFTIVLGGGLVRTTLEADLRERGACHESYSLLVGHEARHVDCVNIVTHAARDTRSRQTARCIASGVSRVVFNTKVIVNSGAVHAESQQSCRGLLLSAGAEIDSRPQLEIHADEVKCAHGATTGRLDPDMLFYMLSRGLDRETAQSLLVYAFLADVLADMSVPAARAAIENALIAQLPDSHILSKFR